MTQATPAERAAFGRQVRSTVPRSRHGAWEPTADRTDPLEILALQATTRLPDLVPIRYGRMAESAFAFYRGAAAVMAADLGREVQTGLNVQLCGDAHLSNFGGFASPERDMIFDVNDFDETIPGPFEWDLKRLAASFEIAARARDLDEVDRRAVVTRSARSYRSAIREFATMRNLEIWNSLMDVGAIRARWGSEVTRSVNELLARRVAKAQSKDHLKALAELTVEKDGKLRFISDPPLMVPVEEAFTDVYSYHNLTNLLGALSDYRATLSGDRQRLIDKYEFTDLARKVVGVGSVGTRCWVALFVGRDSSDPLVLQVKQAERAVGEPFLLQSQYENQGQRVVEGQRLMQGASDIFLGWDQFQGEDGITRDFYLRQLWDWKLSARIDRMPLDMFAVYGELCGWVLARAHARSGDAIAIGAYLGAGDRFDQSMWEFARTYADQNDRDFARLQQAVASGQVAATTGI